MVTVLVSARAPADEDARPRTPLNLALVLDRSGSMRGQPLQEACRCAGLVIEGLGATDRASLVVFGDEVDVLVPNRLVGDPAAFRVALAGVAPGGATALHDGWRIGADQAVIGHEPGMLSRVLLLSDGNANRGLTNPEAVARRCADALEQGVSTSTYGLGRRFNEELMLEMARAGGGNGYYGQTAEDLLDPFREEFDLLRAICATRLRLRLDAPEGVEVSVLNRYPRGDDGRWALPDLAAGGEAWALVQLRIPRALRTRAEGGEVEILRAALELDRRDEGPSTVRPARLALPFVPPEAYAALAEDERIRQRAQELRAADLQEEARIAARQREWNRVDELLDSARIESADNPWIVRTLDALERYARQRHTEAFSKEAMYSAAKYRSRLADPSDTDLAGYDASAESAKARYLRRKMQQGKRMDR
jgi:Ca-activated chloride channel family protein